MRRSVLELAAVGFVLIVGTGCALDEGQPWGVVEIGVSVQFSPPPTRFDEQGRLKTATDYRVVIDEIVAVGQEARLPMLADATAGFDPANPPDGYSLCHNGHCHAASGALVDYADIAAELATDGGGAAIAVTLAGQASVVAAPTSFATIGCENGCLAPAGEITTAVVSFASVRVRGRAFDSRTGELARLGEDGVAFDLVTPEAVSIAGTLAQPEVFGSGSRNDVLMNLDVLISERLLDDIDFSTLSGADPNDGSDMSSALSNSTLTATATH